jgi:hypothetical protein
VGWRNYSLTKRRDLAESSPSDVLMSVFEHAADAKAVGIILEQEDGTIRYHSNSTSMVTQLGLLTFSLMACMGQVLRGSSE